jgi:tetratricopeptide (TPR) repeat protein
MRWFRVLLCGALWFGCAGRLPEAAAPTMVRSFHGTLVPGYYVSPSAYQHYIQAQLFSNDGRAEEAAEELRHALAADGASAYLRTCLVEELLALGRVDEARDEVEAALHLDPQFAEAYVDLARVKLRLGDAGSAETALKRAIEIDRTCEDAYVTLVGIYRERGLDARAEETWRALARAVPTSAPAQQALGRLARARDDEKSAESAFRRALELDPGLQEARVELAELYQGQGRIDAAATLYADAFDRSGDTKVAEMLVRLYVAAGHEARARELVDRLDDDGGPVERRLVVGWLRLAARQPERARAIADEVLTRGESPAARLLAGAALEQAGQSDLALAQLQRVPLQSNDFVAAEERIARLLGEGGRYREAVELVGHAIAEVSTATPSGAGMADQLEDLLAQLHERAGNPELATRGLERALERHPQSPTLAFALAAVYQRAGKWERAVDMVRSVVLRRDPDSPQALNFIGYALAERGVRLDEARRLLEKALALKPSSGEIADSLGWLFVKLGQLDRAERLLLRADRLAPEEPEILQHLGALYVKKADRARALEAYRRALSHHPEDQLRRTLEEQILLLETGRVGSR